MESSSVGRSKKAATISPFELSFLEFCSRKRSFGEKISDSDRSYFYKCEFCPGKKLRNEDELEEHLDSLHTERTCSECGGNFLTKKAFDAHQHKEMPSGETNTNIISGQDPSDKSSHNNGEGVLKQEQVDIKSSNTNSKDLNNESNEKIEVTTNLPEKNDVSVKGQFIFECTECQESFPTQFHLSTHIRDSHSIPQCSLPPKKRSSPLKNWSPKSDEKEEKESHEQQQQNPPLPPPPPPLTSTLQRQVLREEEESCENEPKLESNIDSPEKTEEAAAATKEEQSPRKRRKKTDLLPISDDVQLEAVPARRNRTRKNYTDIDLYLDESEEEAILQKILKQTSRLRRGRKSKNEHSVNNNSVTKSDNESINESTNDSLHKRESLSSTRGKRRGRCKKV